MAKSPKRLARLNQKDPDGLVAWLYRYIQHRKLLGTSEAGVYNIERHGLEFIEWCEARALMRPQDITRQILQRYQRTLFYYRKANGEPLSINSQRSMLQPLRSWFRWMTRENILLYNPASELELPRKRKTLPKSVLTVEEVEHIMTLPNIHTVVGLRDRCMLEVLYATGIRRMELRNLNFDDLDFNRMTMVVVQGKGYKDRILPLSQRAAYWIKKYLGESRPRLETNLNERALFLTYLGQRFNLMWIGTTVAGYVRKAKLGKTGGCHLFRHTMATLMLENGADIRYIQVMLGHEDPSTTQIYTRVSVNQLAKVHAMAHPGQLTQRYLPKDNAIAEHNTAFLEQLAQEEDDDHELELPLER